MAKFEGGQLVQAILTKGGLRVPKALVVKTSWAPRLPPPCHPAGLGLVAPIWKPLPDASRLFAYACSFSTKEETSTLRPLAPAWPWSSCLTSREPHEVPLALISPLLMSQPSEAAPEEVLCRPPREGLECLLVKMGRTRPLEEPRHGPQAGKSGNPRSQSADNNFPRKPRENVPSRISAALDRKRFR